MVFQYIRTVLIGVLVSCCISSFAMDNDEKDKELSGYLLSGFLSKHFGNSEKYNEQNHGLGVLFDNGWGGGYYRNSLNKDSWYLIKELEKELGKLGPVTFSGNLDLGLVTGYKKPLTPVVLPSLGAQIGDYKLNLGGVPPIPGVTPATLALQLRKKF